MADCEPWTRKIDRKSQGHILLPKNKFQAFTEEITLNSLGILFYFILFFTFSPNWACIYLFFKLLLFFLLWWILSFIEMKQPCVYMCSPSWSPLPPLSPPAPSRSSQCTRSERLSHAYNLGWWSVSRSTVYHSQYMEAT